MIKPGHGIAPRATPLFHEVTRKPESYGSSGILHALFLATILSVSTQSLPAQEAPKWQYSAQEMQPFWRSDVVYRESVLFIRDPQSGEARASVLFPIKQIVAIQNSAGTTVYQQGHDFHWSAGSAEITVPGGSGIVTRLAEDLRRPAGSQKHRLTHRDGRGEILFGATLEYHNMQTWVTYTKAEHDWPVDMPTFDSSRLPRTIRRLRQADELSIVLLGDSISTGCNSSGWGKGAPWQPPWQELLRQHLATHYRTKVNLANLAVGGTSTPWGIQQVENVVAEKPHLVILAFGMNDSARLNASDYGQNISDMIKRTRASLPDAEFILVAPMLGNRDWTTLKHDVFPRYRNELSKLTGPGIALADMTSVWHEFLKRKQDRDLTGNGVNHPNDFGHRVYAQVLAALLTDGQ